ncbi:MAG TPA: hypothetical protein VMV77_08935 [Bacteroidales bacterium]|nr:hypothetical protein [Bacteroidales bacterium]
MVRNIYILIALYLVVLKAASDGLALAHHHMIAGIIESIWFGGIVLTIYGFFTGILENQRRDVGRFIKVIAGFLLLRFALFNVIHNLFAGLDWNFIGNTKLIDIMIQKFFVWSGFPLNFLFWPYLFCFIGGITLLYKKKDVR